MSELKLFLAFIFVLSAVPDRICAKDVVVELNAYYFEAAPDGVKKQVLGVNGQFPGPTIHVDLNDTLIVRVTNSIQDEDGEKFPTSVHWHGIEMFLTPWYDGPEGVTQCPIPYGESMEYRFRLYQSGTYWYHSHHSWQYVEGFWGLLIVHNKPEVYKYDDDLSISLTDWHHEPAKILSVLYHNRTIPTPTPDTGLINGRGFYPCEYAMAQGFQCNPAYQSPALLTVNPGKTYRIRVINTSARSNFRFSIDGHKLRTIEVDGVDTVEVAGVDAVDVWPAQRYSFLVTMDGSMDEYWVRTVMTSIRQGVDQPKAILKYNRESCVLEGEVGTLQEPEGVQGRPAKHDLVDWVDLEMKRSKIQVSTLFNPNIDQYVFPTEIPPPDGGIKTRAADERHMMELASVELPRSKAPATPDVLDPNLCRPKESRGQTSAPDYCDEMVVLNATFGTRTDIITGNINGVAYQVDTPPVIVRMIKNLPLNLSTNPQHTPLLKRVIQIVINNQNGGSHPWHLHGHTFWVLGSGPGNYTESRDAGKLNVNGVRRDTVETLANSWVVVRYETDNPGAWLLHCHINWHLEIGLGAVFIEGEQELRDHFNIPDEARRVCALNNIDL